MRLERFENWYDERPRGISEARWNAMCAQMEGARNTADITAEIERVDEKLREYPFHKFEAKGKL